jgi:hypothetical protein
MMTRAIALRVSPPFVGLVLLIAAGVYALWSHRARPPVQPVDPEIICVEPVAQPDPPPEKPMPGDDVYTRLQACFDKPQQFVKDMHVTVAQVRYWVEVEHDPVWRENGAWWLPLSGEGEPTFPSGIYISVPDIGPTCGGAIVN